MEKFNEGALNIPIFINAYILRDMVSLYCYGLMDRVLSQSEWS